MAFSSQHFEIIEEIRLYKGLSVRELCENIISERSYYRYLHTSEEIPYHIFNLFIDRLKINLAQFMTYSFFFYKNPSAIHRFIFRVQTTSFFDIDVLYEKIKMEETQVLSQRLMIQSYIKKFEFIVNKISKEDYVKYLEESLKELESVDVNIFKSLVESLYLEISDKQKLVDIGKATKDVLNQDFKLSVNFYAFTLDNLLQSMLLHEEFNRDIFIMLLVKLKEISNYLPLKFLDMKILLYEAYLEKKNEDEQKMKDYLYRVGLIAIQIFERKPYQFHVKRIKQIFGIDLMTWLVEYSPYIF